MNRARSYLGAKAQMTGLLVQVVRAAKTIWVRRSNVRFTPESGHLGAVQQCLLSAISGHFDCSVKLCSRPLSHNDGSKKAWVGHFLATFKD